MPMMILLYLGAVELFQAATLYRLVSVTASTVTNLVTQYTTISASTTMADILDAAVQVLSPNPSINATVVVSSITIDQNGNATVAWSQTLNGQARPVGQVVSVPSALDIANTTLILGEVTYGYTPTFDVLNFGAFNLSSSIFMVPRDSTTINLAP